ncbi:MAG: hypothetical protein J0L92_25275 [Deltaproteobacteria bacterium]|nr:hypothetical protein [Deltaproteobacteria bacterium]
MTDPREKRVSTPLVLAASSGMIAIGFVAVMGVQTAGRVENEEEERAQLAALVLDDRTEEAVAESYLDAWRRRAWDDAARVSVADAHDAALHKKQLDQEMDPTDRAMAREVWERLASAPLEVQFTGSEDLEGGAVALSGVAAYQFMGSPYRREVRWEVVPAEGDEQHLFRVRRMENGEVLSEIPGLLRGEE